MSQNCPSAEGRRGDGVRRGDGHDHEEGDAEEAFHAHMVMRPHRSPTIRDHEMTFVAAGDPPLQTPCERGA